MSVAPQFTAPANRNVPSRWSWSAAAALPCWCWRFRRRGRGAGAGDAGGEGVAWRAADPAPPNCQASVAVEPAVAWTQEAPVQMNKVQIGLSFQECGYAIIKISMWLLSNGEELQWDPLWRNTPAQKDILPQETSFVVVYHLELNFKTLYDAMLKFQFFTPSHVG